MFNLSNCPEIFGLTRLPSRLDFIACATIGFQGEQTATMPKIKSQVSHGKAGEDEALFLLALDHVLPGAGGAEPQGV